MPTTTLQVTFVSESAAYDNTFGWYNKVTGRGGILFADVEMQGHNAPLTPGATRTFTVDTADLANISFFLIPDGADHNPPDDLTGNIKVIQLSNGRWAVADVDANGNVIYIHGRPDILEGVGADALFTETSKNAGGVDYASSVAGPNQTAATLAGDTADGPTGLIAWEDIAAKKHGSTYGAPGDADYNDAVFNVSILPPPNTAPETSAAAASGNEDATIAIALSGSDTDGTVTSFQITSLPPNGTLYSDAGLTQQIPLNGTVTAVGNAATVYFVPAANFNGGTSFQYASIDNGGAQDQTPATASITVTAVNDAPTATNLTQSLTVDEDAAPATLFTLAPTVADVDSASVTATLTIAAAQGTLDGAGVGVLAAGIWTYTITGAPATVATALANVTFDSAADFNGAASVDVTISDGQNGPQGTNPSGTVSITVNPVNDAPTATNLTQSLTIDEDAAPTTLFTLAPTVADIDSASLTATLTVAAAQGTLDGAGAGVLSAGVWTYTITGAPAAVATALAGVSFDSAQDFNGSASVDVTISDGQNGPQGTNPTGTVTVTVHPVNDAPVVTAPGAVNTFIEGAGLATGTPVLVDDAFTVSDDNANLASATISITGGLQAGDVLSFTPQFGITDTNAADDILALSGSATLAEWETVLRSIAFATSNQDPTTSRTISIQVSDGTSNSATITKNVTITPVNDEPTLTATADNGGAVTFIETSLPGDAGTGPIDLFDGAAASTVEAGQGITQLVVTVGNVGDTTEFLMIGGTAVDLAHGNSEAVTGGTASVSIAGGTATVTINATTTFTTAQVQTLVDSLAYDNNDNTPTATTHTISVTSLTDDGANGGLNGDDNTGAPTLSTVVTVQPTNDAPTALDVTFQTSGGTFAGNTAAIGNTSLVLDDPSDGAPNPAGPQKTVTGDLLSLATDVDTASTSWTITAADGTSTVSNAAGTIVFETDGDFTYTPAAGFTGDAIFNYRVNDNDALGNKFDVAQITINVAAPKVWYVDATNGNDATGDGTSDNPFKTLTVLNGVTGDGTTGDDVDGAGDIIFMYGGTYAGGIVLEDGQQLISKEHGLTVNGTVLEAADSGSLTTINGTVTLASGATANNIQGIDFGASAAGQFALTGTNVGNATVNTVTAGLINNTSGGAISINGSGATMNLQFTSVTSTGGTSGLEFLNASGTFNAGAGALSGATGNAVNIDGNDASDDLTFTYGGSISGDANELVNVTDQTGGTITFNGTITDGAALGGGIDVSSNTGSTTVTFTHSVSLNTGNATGVNFAGNAGTVALNFNNTNVASTGLDITTAGGTGFNATGGGTVTVLDPTGAQSNSISSGSGGALNVVNTSIGSGGLTFQSISATGASSGIVLNNTGTAAGNGGLTVTGSGVTDGSGGTIANSTTSGISLTSTKNVNLSNMNVSGSADDGILGSGVNGFTLTNANVTGNGNSTTDRGVELQDLSGSGSVTNSVFSGSASDNFLIINSGTTTLTGQLFTGNTFQTTNFTTGDDGLRLENNGSGTMTAWVNNNTFTDNKGDHFQFATTASASGLSNIQFNGNTLTTTAGNDPNVIGGGITISPSGSADLVIEIDGNNIQQAFDDGININAGTASTAAASINATINNNIIGTAGQADSGSESSNTITITSNGAGTNTIAVTNNDVFQYGNGSGILLHNKEGSSLLNATVTGNTVKNPGTFAINAIRVDAGATATDSGTIHLLIQNNDVTGGGKNSSAGEEDIRLRSRFNTDVDLTGYAGAVNDNAAIATFLATQNDPVSTPTVSVSANAPSEVAGIVASPPTPTLPPDPLFAAEGGVQAAAGVTAGSILAQDGLTSLAVAAVGRWAATGLPVEQLAALDGLTVSVADLGGSLLGLSATGQIVIDDDGAGRGWFIDTTPFDDAEFAHALSATQLQTDASGAPAGQMDLLTVIMHEMGHALGLDDTYAAADGDDLMSATLVTGERRLPDATDVLTAQQATLLRAPEIVGATIVNGFDAEYYLAHNPDVAAAGVDPLAHYNSHGWHEGRDPNAFFDTVGYLAHYADVAAAGMNPLEHYEQFGWKEGRDPSTRFDTQAYLAANPDVAAAGANPLDHFLQHGFHEGRDALTDGMWRY